MLKVPAILRKPSVNNGKGCFGSIFYEKSWIWKLVTKVQPECIFGHLHSHLSSVVLVTQSLDLSGESGP
jgi:hypothetical protein